MSDKHSVGYGKPPKEHQFRPGKSGNARGRPRRETVDIAAMLREPIACSVNGEKVVKSAFEAGLHSTVAKALKRDMRAAARFLKECESAKLICHYETPDLQNIFHVPKDWDWDEWVAMFEEQGPPPWKGARDGLPKTPPWQPRRA